MPLDTEDSEGETPAVCADSQGHPRCADLIRRLAHQHTQHTTLLLDINKAIKDNEFGCASNMFRSTLGKEAHLRMKPAFVSVVKALNQHADMMVQAMWNDDVVQEPGAGAGGKQQQQQQSAKKSKGKGATTKKKQQHTACPIGTSKKKEEKAVKETAAVAPLDDDTIIDIINKRLHGTDDDWASLSPARLRTLLLQASPDTTASVGRIKGIKAAVLAARLLQAGIDSGEVRACSICLSAAADYALQHGGTAHQCLCKGCAESGMLIAGVSRCTMCRKPIDSIVAACDVASGVVVYVV